MYYATLDQDGTEDEITIRTPEGRAMATILFWDEMETANASTARANAQIILDALNASKSLHDTNSHDTTMQGATNALHHLNLTSGV